MNVRSCRAGPHPKGRTGPSTPTARRPRGLCRACSLESGAWHCKAGGAASGTAGRHGRPAPSEAALASPRPRPEAAAAPGSPALGAVHAAAGVAWGATSKPAAHPAAMAGGWGRRTIGGQGGQPAGGGSGRIGRGLPAASWRIDGQHDRSPCQATRCKGGKVAVAAAIDVALCARSTAPGGAPACAPQSPDCLVVLSMRRRIGWRRLMSPAGAEVAGAAGRAGPRHRALDTHAIVQQHHHGLVVGH